MHDLGASNVCDRRSFVARERRWSHRPLSLCRVCLSSQISILARCEIQIFEAERLAFVCDSVNYVLTSSVQFSPSSDLRRSSQGRVFEAPSRRVTHTVRLDDRPGVVWEGPRRYQGYLGMTMRYLKVGAACACGACVHRVQAVALVSPGRHTTS